VARTALYRKAGLSRMVSQELSARKRRSPSVPIMLAPH
jgi:hypothetical protein